MTVALHRLVLVEEQRQLVVRGDSVEYNLLRASVAGVRVYHGGCVAVASEQLGPGGRVNWRGLEERAHRILRAVARSCGGGGFAEARLYSGRVRLGSRVDVDVGEVAEVVRQRCPAGARCEAVVTLARRERVVEHGSGVAVEEKNYYLVEASVEHGSALGAAFTGGVAFSSGAPVKSLEQLLGQALEEARAASKAKPVSPLEYGRARLVLSPEAAAVLLHEVSHLLDPEYAGREMRGLRIASPQLTIYDEPASPIAPSARFFDDEGVAAQRRVLVEDGRVVDMHFTRRTAWRFQGRPGSAHGLFTTPRGFHTTLVVEAGDWRLEEMFEEVRHGFYIATVAAGFSERGLVRLVPRLAFRVENRELQPVKLRAVKVPVRNLQTIVAIGRSRGLRVSLERGEWLVSEIAPPLILEAYIE